VGLRRREPHLTLTLTLILADGLSLTPAAVLRGLPTPRERMAP
jgi:hypothetical protein